MELHYSQEWPQFFTVTIQQWKHLLKEDKYKMITSPRLVLVVTINKEQPTAHSPRPGLIQPMQYRRVIKNNKSKSPMSWGFCVMGNLYYAL